MGFAQPRVAQYYQVRECDIPGKCSDKSTDCRTTTATTRNSNTYGARRHRAHTEGTRRMRLHKAARDRARQARSAQKLVQGNGIEQRNKRRWSAWSNPPPRGGQGRGEGTHRQAVAPRRHHRPETTTLLLPVPQAPEALTRRVPVARASASDLPQNPHHLRQHQQQQRPGTRHGTRRNNDSNNQTAVTKRRSAGAAVAHRWSDGCSQQPRRGRSGKRRSP